MGLYHVCKNGRVYVKDINGICGKKGRIVPEHRFEMSKHLKRKLKEDECVIHRDGNYLNNDISNLELTTRGEIGHRYGAKNRKKPKTTYTLVETILLSSIIGRMRDMEDYSAPKNF
ncbi:MAG: HNH endonuclease [Chaetfec virus UA24_144]|nr:MAG: HNH endonuclease [Chaetfec virus UA24_144]